MLDATTSHPVVLYGRASIERGKSVDDQLAVLREWARREGWPVIAEHRDDGISASRYANGKTRAGWEQVMGLVSAQQVRAVLVWELSRATRDKAVSAALETACAASGVKIGYHGRLHDPTTSDGGFQIGLDTILAARESAVISERTQRAVDSRAAAGRPNGALPYGYRRVVDQGTGRIVEREIHPEQGPIVAEIVRRLLAREPANGIAADLNRREVPTATGKQWRGGNLRILAVRPTYAGLRVYRGEVLDGVKATWPPIITETQHLQLVEMFADPARDKFRNPTYAKHLGTGIFRCGRDGCDGRMRVVAQVDRPNRYDCRTCHRVSRHQGPVDDLVEALVCARLSRRDALAAIGAADDPGAAEATAEAARLKLKLRAARQAWDDDRMSLESFTDMELRTLPKIRAAEVRARPRHLPPALYDVAAAGVAAERVWKALPIGERRAIVAALVDVVILPAGRGRWKFDPHDISIKWRTS